MYKLVIVVFFYFLHLNYIAGQEFVPQVLNKALTYRGLTVNDLTIPIDTLDQPNTNQCKLILPVVYNLMINSASSFEFMDKVMDYRELSIEEMVVRMFKDINYYREILPNSYTYSSDAGTLGLMLIERIKLAREKEHKLLSVFTEDESQFLQKNIMIYFESSDTNDSFLNDIYEFNKVQDSAEAAAKKLLDLLSKVSKEEIFSNSMDDFYFCYKLFQFLSGSKIEYANQDIIYEYKKEDLSIVIGGIGNNSYRGDYDFIIDLGGNDVYDIEGKNRIGNNFNCIIDLSGRDLYSTGYNYSLAAGMFSSGFIFDGDGDDTYRAKNVSLAAAICGLGLIYDVSGSDIYEGTNFSIGAGMFGAGLLYDVEGNDFYIANTYSQGFGMTQGIGTVLDKKGNDSYLISPVTLDINRYNDHYLSMCQGYGFGLRPYYAGGIGYLIEGEGNDVYSCDIFGQGGSYWYSLGVIADKSGNDKYSGFHYNQGSGIHFSVGLHKDYEGWDYYSSNWVSQGCGHDYAVGILWDMHGNDLYSCDGLSQGAGNANGIGILVDENGRDGYLSKDFNTRGYGQPLRNFGSIGLLADASGRDFYSSSGADSSVSYQSTWGLSLDDYLPEVVTQTQESDFRIEVDSAKTYSMDDYYLFARTLEIKFSKIAGFGFERMIKDSVNSATYILPKMGSADIRDVVLMRNLNSRIGYSITNLLTERLSDYMMNPTIFNTDEVTFMCYLIGEAKNKSANEILLQLTYNENYRIRASAINALGKLDFQIEDTEFVNKVSERLISLAKENSSKKLYNKEIAFAFNKFMQESAIPVLINMMSHDYYGVRFVAADVLKLNSSIYYMYAVDAFRSHYYKEIPWLGAFIYSLSNLKKEEIQNITEIMLDKGNSDNETVLINISELIKNKIDSTNDKSFRKWGKKIISTIENKIRLRNK